jgi:hypothetical protein
LKNWVKFGRAKYLQRSSSISSFKLTRMVTTEVSQLSRECSTWLEQLRAQREKLTANKTRLRSLCGPATTPDVCTEIEHLDNQFHIQLINIHDLKHEIKKHEHKIAQERKVTDGLVSDDSLVRHESLFDDYQRLGNTLHEIGQEFEYFVRQAK